MAGRVTRGNPREGEYAQIRRRPFFSTRLGARSADEGVILTAIRRRVAQEEYICTHPSQPQSPGQ
jgi:hypothetical protein